MRNIISDYLIENWETIEPNGVLPSKIDVIKLDGRSDADATLNFVIFVDNDPGPRLMAKINRVAGKEHTVAAEFENLNRIKGLIGTLEGCRAPEPVILGSLDGGNSILVQTFLPGRKIGLKNISDAQKLFFMAFRWLELLYSASNKEIFINDAAELKNAFEGKVSSVKFEKRLSDKLAHIARCISRLGDFKIKRSASQGDFDFDNLIIYGNALSITDWEDYKENSHPFLDAEFFVFNTALYFYEKFGHQASFDKFFAKNKQTRRLADRYIAGYCKFLDVPKPVFYIFAIMDTIEMMRDGYGKHVMVPMQNIGFLERLTDLAIEEIEYGSI